MQQQFVFVYIQFSILYVLFISWNDKLTSFSVEKQTFFNLNLKISIFLYYLRFSSAATFDSYYSRLKNIVCPLTQAVRSDSVTENGFNFISIFIFIRSINIFMLNYSFRVSEF